MANSRPRAREGGIIIGTLNPGPNNAITDVPGVLVGQATLIRGEGVLHPGRGPVRTGVTAILPHGGNLFREKVKAASFVLNGFGKTIGLVQIDELGTLETPILLTNTLNVGRVADALIDHMLEENPEIGVTTGTVNPVVAECNDGFLNDLQGRHVGREEVREAIRTAAGGPVKEGSVGAGTGMSAFGFKGGIGTSSREIGPQAGGYLVGTLALANFGRREELVVAGVPVGRVLKDWRPEGEPEGDQGTGTGLTRDRIPLRPKTPGTKPGQERGAEGHRSVQAGTASPVAVSRPLTGGVGGPENGQGNGPGTGPGDGSIIIVVATNAPLSSRQLGRLARRAVLGLARTGSTASNGSGDIVLAFSTAHRISHYADEKVLLGEGLPEGNRYFGPLFQAVIESTEESILNALFRAETMVGRDGNIRYALPLERVLEILQRFPREV
ncbi:MAG: P1 family peptidase [Firmicutes bacterium]|nr:P1 family peptidase [Bacillota bacterium]